MNYVKKGCPKPGLDIFILWPLFLTYVPSDLVEKARPIAFCFKNINETVAEFIAFPGSTHESPGFVRCRFWGCKARLGPGTLHLSPAPALLVWGPHRGVRTGTFCSGRFSGGGLRCGLFCEGTCVFSSEVRQSSQRGFMILSSFGRFCFLGR